MKKNNKMNQPNFTTTVNGKPVVCHTNLQEFKILKMASSNVDYYAINLSTNELFIQFLNGQCYVYDKIPKEVLELAEDCESIGKYYFKFIKGKYNEQKVGNLCIQPHDEEEEESDTDDLSFSDQDFDFE